MSITYITEGENVSLGNTNHLIIGFGWKNEPEEDETSVDIVPAVILCDKNNKIISDDYFIFFNQLRISDTNDSIVLIPESSGQDKQQVEVKLDKLSDNVKSLAFVLYSNPVYQEHVDINAVKDIYIRVMNNQGQEIYHYDIDVSNGQQAGCYIAEVYLYQDSWNLRAVKHGFVGGIEEIVKLFGVLL